MLAGSWEVTEMHSFMRSEVLILVVMKIQAFWDFTPYQLVKLPMLL
jgi:hypothetical protein